MGLDSNETMPLRLELFESISRDKKLLGENLLGNAEAEQFVFIIKLATTLQPIIEHIIKDFK